MQVFCRLQKNKRMECNFVKAGTVRKETKQQKLPSAVLSGTYKPALVSQGRSIEICRIRIQGAAKCQCSWFCRSTSAKKTTLYYTGFCPNRKLFLYAKKRQSNSPFEGRTRARLVKVGLSLSFPASNKLHNAPRNKRAPASL